MNIDIDEILKQYCDIKYWKDSQEVSSVRLKKTQRKCPDCDLIVDSDRRVHINYNSNPINHWKAHCNKCRLCANPETGKFDTTSSEIFKYHYARKHNQDQNKDK